jgi:ferric-dicitrate binding protein FerR (iron transport regulator)
MDTLVLISKVLSGTASPAEQSELEQWVSKGRENKTEFHDLKLLWLCEHQSAIVPEQSQQALTKFRATIMADTRKQRLSTRAVHTSVVLAVTTSIILLLLNHLYVPKHALGTICFNSEPLAQIVLRLEDEYKVTIIADNQICHCTFTGTFYGMTNASPILESLAESLNINHTIQPDGVHRLSGTHCANESSPNKPL